jgi:Xaa-Pro dipeptidase
MNERISRLQTSLVAAGVDGIFIVPGANFYYLTGLNLFTWERTTLLYIPAQGAPSAVMPKLEAPNARPHFPAEVEFFPWADGERALTAMVALAESKGLKKDGHYAVEALYMRVQEKWIIEEVLAGASFTNADPLVAALRMCKDRAELDCMIKASEITEQALRATLPMIKPGVTEGEIAIELKVQMLRLGSGPLPKEPVVASGPRSSNPHTKTSDGKLEAGDLVMIDTGATYKGYAADITRTFAVAHLSDELRKVYETVKAANAAALAATRAGAECQLIDAAARKVIDDAGYGQYFIHRVGHGLGLEGHEYPYMVKGNRMKLEAGMVFTDEPGIYLPGVGGVRIEDNVAVTANGYELLNQFTKDLIVL